MTVKQLKVERLGRMIIAKDEEGNEMTYYEQYEEGTNIIVWTYCQAHENTFRFDGRVPKKYGRGKMKNERRVYEFLEAADAAVRAEGYIFGTTF